MLPTTAHNFTADRSLADALDGARSLPSLPPQPITKGGRFLPLTCENGPRRVIHSIEDEFHIPQIYKGTCTGLPCEDESCRIKRSQQKRKCVLVYRFVRGQWVRIGFRTVRYLDHLECECKQCKHITSRAACIETTSCPNVNSETSHCYWRPFIFPTDGVSQQEIELTDEAQLERELMPVPVPGPVPIGRCDCCTPFTCRPPKVFNKQTCSCKCRPTFCKPPKYQDQSTCRCRCPPARCVPPRVQNPITCNCECPKGTTSSGRKCVGK